MLLTLGSRGKEFEVQLGPKILKVMHKATVLVEGTLAYAIKSDDSTWMLDSKNNAVGGMRQQELCIHLQKQADNEWWAHILTKEPMLDTTKILPEASSLSDIKDPEMKSMVEKMMLEQRQKSIAQQQQQQQGMNLESSVPSNSIVNGSQGIDQAQKMALLDNFKKQNPHLDFSKANVTF